LWTMVNPGTKVILRTDAAPFRVLVDGPPSMDNKAGSHP
jgi:modulator of FtsH protease HflC